LKLAVPYVGNPQPLDRRLLRLADFLGIPCYALKLATAFDHAEYLAKVVPDECSCFVVNPQVMKEWVGQHGVSRQLSAFLLSRFTHLFVHGLRVNAFDSEVVSALSGGKLQSVDAITGVSPTYVIHADSASVCGTFHSAR